jgi:SGNH hydrolase-like domain, acetyltransferase AlgX
VSTVPLWSEATIGRWTARAVTGAFVALIALPVGLELSNGTLRALVRDLPDDVRAVGLAEALRQFETRFERKGVLQEDVRPLYRSGLFQLFNKAAQNTNPGCAGFLYYHDDLNFQWGPGPLSARQVARLVDKVDTRDDAFADLVRDACQRLLRMPEPVRPAPPPYEPAQVVVLDVVRQLKARGIPVLVVVLPGKAVIYPEYYAEDYPIGAGPALNRGLRDWEDLLRGEGVSVVDVIHPLWDAKGRMNKLLFLKTDSHWSPTGLAVAADAMAAAAEPILGKATVSPFSAEPETITIAGDQPGLLDLADSYKRFPPEEITLARVRGPEGDDVDGNAAPVLLLGDSYTTMYRDHGADLPSQLMLRLGRGVQTIAAPGITPAAVLHLLSMRPDALTRKKLVIWTFVDRTINKVEAWTTAPLPAP